MGTMYPLVHITIAIAHICELPAKEERHGWSKAGLLPVLRDSYTWELWVQRRQGTAYKGPKEGPASGQGRQWVRDQTEPWRSVLMPAHCFSEVSLGWPVSLSSKWEICARAS